MDEEKLNRLKVAFVLDYVKRIVAADGVESYDEFRMIGEIFPRPLLRDFGFLAEDDELTDVWRDHRDMAHQLLPSQVPVGGREDIFTLLYEACAIDELAPEEMRVLTEAGVALGFTSDEVTALIAAAAQD